MASSQEDSPSSMALVPKSKQERIRHNQRRSRARRQEYLADLEQRLRDCHSTCREADLQRAGFLDLQRENHSLRELLELAGVSTDLVDSFIRQHALTSPQRQTDAPGSLRQLKPKIQVHSSSQPASLNSSSEQIQSAPSLTCCNGDSPSYSTQVPENDVLSQFSPDNSSLIGANVPDATFLVPWSTDDWDWMPDDVLSKFGATLPDDRPNPQFCRGTFNVPPNGPLLENDKNSIPCSLAKDLLDQHNIPPDEMKKVKQRLASGFSRPTAPGRSCRVNNFVLFQVLSEISIKYG